MNTNELLEILEQYRDSWNDLMRLQIARSPGDIKARKRTEKENSYLYKKLQYCIIISKENNHD